MLSLIPSHSVTSSRNDSGSTQHASIAEQAQRFQNNFSGLSISPQYFLSDKKNNQKIEKYEDGEPQVLSPISVPPNKTGNYGSESSGESSSAESIDISIKVEQTETQEKSSLKKINSTLVTKRHVKDKANLSACFRRSLSPISRPMTQALRVGLCTGAGRTMSWLIRQNLQPGWGSVTTPITIAASLLRSVSAYALVHNASRSVERKSVRRAAQTGGVVCSALMLAPTLYACRNPSTTLAHNILLDNLADLGYVMVRDPLQDTSRNFFPGVSLSAREAPGTPNLLAFVPLSMTYSVSAMLWALAFEFKINPASLTLGPLAYSAVKSITPAAVIEATEAAAAVIIFSSFPGAQKYGNWTLKMPRPHVFLTTAAMRLFATGLLQLGHLIAHIFFGRPNGMPMIVFGMVMLLLEWLGAVAQQAIANISIPEPQTLSKTAEDNQKTHSKSIGMQTR